MVRRDASRTAANASGRISSRVAAASSSPASARRSRQRAEALLEAVDLLDDRAQPAQRALVRAAEKARQEPWHQERSILVTGLGDVKPNGRYGPRNRSGFRGSGRRCG